jgi:hypothetical protein
MSWLNKKYLNGGMIVHGKPVRQSSATRSHKPLSQHSTKLPHASLELSLRSLERRQHQLADIASGLVQIVAHLVAAETLGDDVEVDAVQSR